MTQFISKCWHTLAWGRGGSSGMCQMSGLLILCLCVDISERQLSPKSLSTFSLLPWSNLKSKSGTHTIKCSQVGRQTVISPSIKSISAIWKTVNKSNKIALKLLIMPKISVSFFLMPSWDHCAYKCVYCERQHRPTAYWIMLVWKQLPISKRLSVTGSKSNTVTTTTSLFFTVLCWVIVIPR